MVSRGQFVCKSITVPDWTSAPERQKIAIEYSETFTKCGEMQSNARFKLLQIARSIIPL